MAKMGRPPIEIDKEQFEKLCQFQCTLVEIAGWFGCSEDTIERFCVKEYNETFAEVFKKKSAGGKISLRRTQFRMAESNCSMAIWLGKQYLGQKDASEIEVRENIDETVREMDEYFAKKRNNGDVVE